MSKIRDILRPTPPGLLAALLLAALLTAACGGDGDGSAGTSGEAGHDHGSTAPAAGTDAGPSTSPASGFRLPTLNELYRPFVVFPITTQANAALKPEKLKGVEGGIDLTPASGVQLSATLFIQHCTSLRLPGQGTVSRVL